MAHTAPAEPSAASWIPLAEVARPHGVRGELRLKLYNQDSDILLDQEQVLVRLASGEELQVVIDKARRADDAILMKLRSVDDRDCADTFRGALICVARDSFPPLEEGEFYFCDIIGARVSMRRSRADEPREEGTPVEIAPSETAPSETAPADDDGALVVLGVVLELRSYPSVEVLVVKAADGGKDWEIPLVDAFIEKLDPTSHEVIVTSLDGLERG